MIKKKLNFKKIIYKKISEMDTYEFAVAFHKTHKREKLKIVGTYLEEIYKDNSRIKNIKKSTQCGISEFLIVWTIKRASEGKMVFYVLPTFELKNQFVKERFDKSISFTYYYKSLLRYSERKFTESTSMKQIKDGTIAFVGSNTEVAFLSFAADDVIIDELDKCNQDNIKMAPERQANSDDKYTLRVANPTFVEKGIDLFFKNSDKRYWNIKCPHCNKYLVPDFFKHVVREIDDNIYIIRDTNYDPENDKDILPICDNCEKSFDRKASGIWVPTQKHDERGWEISKMFSTFVTLRELVDRFNDGLLDDVAMQRFQNGDLGKAYTAKGAKIDEEMLNKCIIPDFIIPKKYEYACVMGVDVGSMLNIVIREILPDGRLRAVYIDEQREENILYELLQKYNIVCAVIDGLPETRLSKKFANSFNGGFMCFFGSEKKDKVSINDKTVTVNRTQMLDAVKEYILTQTMLLPSNVKGIKNYYDQIKASTRVFNEKRNCYEWLEGNNPDHYFLAEGYCITAKRILNIVN